MVLLWATKGSWKKKHPGLENDSIYYLVIPHGLSVFVSQFIVSTRGTVLFRDELIVAAVRAG